VNGTVGGANVFGGFSLLAGLFSIHPLSQQNLKNARSASNFFLAAMLRFGHVARNALAAGKSN
jgi:hypothetical protein